MHRVTNYELTSWETKLRETFNAKVVIARGKSNVPANVTVLAKKNHGVGQPEVVRLLPALAGLYLIPLFLQMDHFFKFASYFTTTSTSGAPAGPAEQDLDVPIDGLDASGRNIGGTGGCVIAY